MKITPLQNKHISAVAEIERACFPDCWGEQTWRSFFSRSDFFGFVAEEGDKVLGYVCGTSLFEDSELLRIAVRIEERKNGLGEKLLCSLIEEAKNKGAEKMFLEVRESNVSAIKLYEKLGFIKLSVRKNYYEGVENAINYLLKI